MKYTNDKDPHEDIAAGEMSLFLITFTIRSTCSQKKSFFFSIVQDEKQKKGKKRRKRNKFYSEQSPLVD